MNEYIVIGLLVVILIGVVVYLVGERSWGKTDPNASRRFAFWFYRKMNRLKVLNKKGYKDSVLLHLIKAGPEITAVSANFNRAKMIIEEKTFYKLIDIYDDSRGYRYIKVESEKYGIAIFEIMEYMRTALNKKIKDEVINTADPEKKDLVKELETRPSLRVIK